MRLRSFITLLLLIGFVLSACGAKRQAKLEDSVKDYFNAVRRKDNNAALSFVRSDKRNRFFEEIQAIEPLAISNLKVDTIFPDEDLNEAVVTALVEYYSPQSAVLSRSRRIYKWSFDSETEAWFLEEENPLGRSPTRGQ